MFFPINPWKMLIQLMFHQAIFVSFVLPATIGKAELVQKMGKDFALDGDYLVRMTKIR